MKKRKSPIVTADGIIVKNGKILLVKRAVSPFLGLWNLPGGHVEYGETVEKAIKREIKEEIGNSVKIKRLLGVYSDSKRDPRYCTVSLAYVLEAPKGKIVLDLEASEFKYFSLNKLPSKIGFDHRKIINDFKKSKK